ncbi:MAG: DUF4105 domain-containing protein [Tannerellaceae bacterium]|jgi:hypothetical protein|nr:DUF4105 domain-containing protein [Tannerellaceae bacterium]
MRRLSFFFLFAICLAAAAAAVPSVSDFSVATLGEDARISLLTSAPSDEEVFTLYGHAAFRVTDLAQGIDCVFNYGIFDFSRPHFIYRFARGHTDYILGVNLYASYRREYESRGSSLTEQILNLTADERQRIWYALCYNALPANRTYRYNFFFDNCATRLPALLERYVDGEILYSPAEGQLSFRRMINFCTRRHPWLTFGCDLALGAPADRIATPHEQLFLPEYLRAAFSEATIRTPTGDVRPLVLAEEVCLGTSLKAEAEQSSPLSPTLVSWALFGLTLLISLHEWFRRRRYPVFYRTFDALLFFTAALGGTVLLFLSLFSEHPALWPNWSLAWLNPLYWMSFGLLFVRRRGVRVYFAVPAALLTAVLLGWYFIPQYFNPAFLPLAFTLWMRSTARTLLD